MLASRGCRRPLTHATVPLSARGHDTSAQFVLLNDAYTALNTPAARRQYDIERGLFRALRRRAAWGPPWAFSNDTVRLRPAGPQTPSPNSTFVYDK